MARSRIPRDLFALFPHPARLRWVAHALRLVQRVGIHQAFRASGLASRLPRRLAALEQITPTVAPTLPELPAVVPAVGTARKRVGLLLGCIQRVFFPDVNAATARVLAAEGCEVVAPPAQECCGALMLHAGRIEDARAAARRIIDVFGRADVDQVVINAAGCGSAMKEYGVLLKDDAEYRGKSAHLFNALRGCLRTARRPRAAGASASLAASRRLPGCVSLEPRTRHSKSAAPVDPVDSRRPVARDR